MIIWNIFRFVVRVGFVKGGDMAEALSPVLLSMIKPACLSISLIFLLVASGMVEDVSFPLADL